MLAETALSILSVLPEFYMESDLFWLVSLQKYCITEWVFSNCLTEQLQWDVSSVLLIMQYVGIYCRQTEEMEENFLPPLY
jgi:hypothetical protein